MLPPILEIYTVWHPDDPGGNAVATDFFDHFHGTLYSGLMGGAVETFSRSEPWPGSNGAPRAIPFDLDSSVAGVPAAEIVVIVPVLAIGLAGAVQSGAGAWYDYLSLILKRREAEPQRVFIMPLSLDRASSRDTVLAKMFGEYQQLGTSAGIANEPVAHSRCRDLCQGIAKLASESPAQRITVFISHTKRSAGTQGASVSELIHTVRRLIAGTRLTAFFDAQDLDVGEKWEPTIRAKAAHSALFALRTDLYASRQWCQKEVRLAKVHGMPVVILEALLGSEERGSFLMDHVPRVAARQTAGTWSDEQIMLALGLLVDECLKRILWRRQQRASSGDGQIEVSWWAPHAPEPLTFTEWLSDGGPSKITSDNMIRILHPDPPLGEDEYFVLDQIVKIANINAGLEVLTPRMLAIRGV